MLNLKEIH